MVTTIIATLLGRFHSWGLGILLPRPPEGAQFTGSSQTDSEDPRHQESLHPPSMGHIISGLLLQLVNMAMGPKASVPPPALSGPQRLAKEQQTNLRVFQALLNTITAIVGECAAGLPAALWSQFLPFLARCIDGCLAARPYPHATRLAACLECLAHLALSRVGQDKIVRIYGLMPAVLQCVALQPGAALQAAECVCVRRAAALLLRNVSFLEGNKVQFANERSLDTLEGIMGRLREGDTAEKCLSAEALLALTYKCTKLRVVIKQHRLWHSELQDMRDALCRTEVGVPTACAACGGLEPGDGLFAGGGCDHVRLRAGECLDKVLGFLI